MLTSIVVALCLALSPVVHARHGSNKSKTVHVKKSVKHHKHA